jgi:predicted dehydrogenase
MTDSDPIPVAVVGAGNMGANHIRVYDGLPKANLVEVVEPDPDRAAEFREQYDVNVVDSVEHIEQATAASVAVPNELHRVTAEALIEQGLDVLVEKPLALTVEDATAIVETSEEHGAILQVGHIERFNPAVKTLRKILKEEEIVALESHRLGPFTEHLSEANVIIDLMIHDLDVISSLVEAPVKFISSYGSNPKSKTADHAVTQIQFKNGVLGTLTASHVTQGKVRTLSVTTVNSYITLDYQKQDVTIQQTGKEGTTSLVNQRGYRSERITESPYIQTREPLKNELEHFISCVKTNTSPVVDGKVGLNSLRLARAVNKEISENDSDKTEYL